MSAEERLVIVAADAAGEPVRTLREVVYQAPANHAMARKLAEGEALDVNQVGRPLEDGQTWRLLAFVEGVDYCDAAGARWIWSIGLDRKTGEIVAATDARFYGDPAFVCLWLR